MEEIVNRAYKIKLRLNDKERAYLSQCVGAARYVYNWALAAHEAYWAEHEKSVHVVNQLKKDFNAIKDEVCPWIYQYPYTLVEAEFAHLQAAFDRFWKERKQGLVAQRIARLKQQGRWDRRLAKLLGKGRSGAQVEPGYPKYKSRNDRQSFTLRGAIRVGNGRIRLPMPRDKTVVNGLGLGGWWRMEEGDYLPAEAKILFVTISRDVNDWYVSIQTEVPATQQAELNGTALAVHRGVRVLAKTLDTNGRVETHENPKALAAIEKKLARLQRELSRREKGSSNWRKTQVKIAKLHQSARRVREHHHHHVSRHVTQRLRPRTIVLDDFGIQKMMMNGQPAESRFIEAYVNRVVGDAGMGELQRQIRYKADWAGIEVVLAEEGERISQRCSQCDELNPDLQPADRIFCCPSCGVVIDRELNSAKNLLNLLNLL